MARPAASAVVSVERFFQFSLLGLVASGYLAVAGSGYLDTPTIVLTAAGLLLRALFIAGVIRLEISERSVTWATLAYIGFFAIDYFLLSRDFLTATVHLVFFLAVVKILTARVSRDYLYTAVIALLELLAAAILSVSVNFFAFLAMFLLFAMAALMSGEIRRSARRAAVTARSGLHRFHARLALLGVSVTLAILTVTAGLFFVLPRTADAAFAGLIPRRILVPGFSTQVTLGEIGEMRTNSRPVMHVMVFGQAPPNLRWRGAALAEFDGWRWSNPPGLRDQVVRLDSGQVHLVPEDFRDGHPGRRIAYHVELDALETDTLFFAGTPEHIVMRQRLLLRTPHDGYRLGQVPARGVAYDAYSLLEEPAASAPPLPVPPVLPLKKRQDYLQLPPLDPRIPELARQFTAGASNDLQRALAIERHLQRDYGYTTELLRQEVRDPLAHFLFERRRGHCEYFASAMTVLLRTQGIPARLVNGFLNGLFNPISELYVVRASDAHSWVEAWMPGRGWTTFDPTPPDASARTLTLAGRIALYLDAAETFWKEWVVSYDLGRQGSLADRMEQGARRVGLRWFDRVGSWSNGWREGSLRWLRTWGWRAGLVILMIFWAVFLGRSLWRLLHVRNRVRRVRLGRAQAGDATLLYGRMLEIMKRRGYQKPAWLTPREFAGSLPPGDSRRVVDEFTVAYNDVRFGGRLESASRLSELLDVLEHQQP